MTYNEIIKALKSEIHLTEYVDGFYADNVSLELLKNTINLMNRQKAEIERLKRENEILSTNADTAFQDGLNEAQDLYVTLVENEIKTDAIKEFAERLKENITSCHTVSDGEYVGYDWTDIIHCIDNLIKEMEEV